MEKKGRFIFMLLNNQIFTPTRFGKLVQIHKKKIKLTRLRTSKICDALIPYSKKQKSHMAKIINEQKPVAIPLPKRTKFIYG